MLKITFRVARQNCNEFIYNDKTISSLDAANAFVDYYKSIFHVNKPYLSTENAQCATSGNGSAMVGRADSARVAVSLITHAKMRRAGKRLGDYLAVGPDRIPAYIVKD